MKNHVFIKVLLNMMFSFETERNALKIFFDLSASKECQRSFVTKLSVHLCFVSFLYTEADLWHVRADSY